MTLLPQCTMARTVVTSRLFAQISVSLGVQLVQGCVICNLLAF